MLEILAVQTKEEQKKLCEKLIEKGFLPKE